MEFVTIYSNTFATLLLLKLFARSSLDDARPSKLIADMRRKMTFDRTFPERNIRDCRWAPVEKFQLPAYCYLLAVPTTYLTHAERTLLSRMHKSLCLSYARGNIVKNVIKSVVEGASGSVWIYYRCGLHRCKRKRAATAEGRLVIKCTD